MARSVWKGPFIDRHLLKLSKLLSDRRDSDKTVQRGNLAFSRVAQMKSRSEATGDAFSTTYDKQKKNIWSRKSVVLPNFVGLTLQIYNGTKFIPVKITQEMIGHKLGEFSPTRNMSSKPGKDDRKGRGLKRK